MSSTFMLCRHHLTVFIFALVALARVMREQDLTQHLKLQHRPTLYVPSANLDTFLPIESSLLALLVGAVHTLRNQERLSVMSVKWASIVSHKAPLPQDRAWTVLPVRFPPPQA